MKSKGERRLLVGKKCWDERGTPEEGSKEVGGSSRAKRRIPLLDEVPMVELSSISRGILKMRRKCTSG